MFTKQPRVLVLAGGTSDEREVSLRSGNAVLAALKTKGYEADVHDVVGYDLTATTFEGFDLAFPVLHGRGGEDGHLQAILDKLGVTYVGAGRQASELCFDKWAYREHLKNNDLPIARGELVDAASFWQSPIITKGFVLKPNDGGSSIDTHIIRDPRALSRQAIEDTFTRHQQLLLEELIEGVEITVGVLGDQALPVIEIIPPESGEFDYENKYNGATQELCPAQNVSADAQQAAQELALRIHQLTDCRHYSRTDMIAQTDGTLIVLETNTLPGMTDQSLFPKAAAADGIDMSELVDRLARMATDA